MPIYGVLTQLNTLSDGKRQNRWWVNAPTIEDALTRGNTLVGLIRAGFGSTTQFFNIHAWEPNSTPNIFRNRPISLPGTYDALNPTNAVPCVKVTLASASSSYPNAKYFRVCVQPNEQLGPNWGAGILSVYTTIVESLSETTFLTDQDGSLITDWALDTKVHYRQLSKKWYNRGS